MKKIFLFILIFTGVVLVFNSCTKDGDLSYLQKGSYETTGSNLNTVQIDSFTIASTQWKQDTTFTIWIAHDTLMPTSPINMSGGVFLFAKEGNDWSAIPHVEAGVQTTFGYRASSRSIEIHCFSANDTVIGVANPGTVTYKIVAIPSRMCQSHPGTNFYNYKSIKETFNLKN